MLKKILSVSFMVGVSLLAGCSEMSEDVPENTQSNIRTETLYLNDEDSYEGVDNINCLYDFDFDGKNETVNIILEEEEPDQWEYKMKVSIGDKNNEVDVYYADISGVFACDIDTDDGVRDLAIVTNEESGDPRIRIFKYDDYLSIYKFRTEFDGEVRSDEYYWTGYVEQPYFNVNEDDSVTIKCQTPSEGMWNVYKTFKRDSSGVFAEVKPKYYEVLPEFMERMLDVFTDMPKDEREKWEQGYVKAYTDYITDEIEINEGDYFKVLYDDGKNNIFVEKEDGTGAWIYIGTDYDGRYEFNEKFFFLAG